MASSLSLTALGAPWPVISRRPDRPDMLSETKGDELVRLFKTNLSRTVIANKNDPHFRSMSRV